MCGIAGFNFKLSDKEKEFVFNKLNHRGPDEKGLYEDKISLFHTRLSIQDLKNSHQPFFYNDYVIVFNGEIYNHLDLRIKLSDFNFKTKGDTETLLYYFLKYGADGLNEIDGMWSFCIYDKKANKLYLSRDRAGKKPLFYYKKNKKFGFSSELNVFKFLDLSLDEKEIKLYLHSGFLESPYYEIKEINPGSLVEVNLENLEMKEFKYFDIYEVYKEEKIKDEKEAIFLIDKALNKSVKNRIISTDVGFGAFLSGGIDSGLVVAKASEFQKINTYTVKFEDSFDESSLAKLVSQKYNTNHTEIEINTKNLKDEIVDIILGYGKPFFDSSAIPSFYVSREARKYEKVVLNGDGADELFGGYRRYVPLRYSLISFAKLLPKLKANKRSLKMFLYRLKRASKYNGFKRYNVMLNDLFIDEFEFREYDEFINSLDLDEFDKMLYLDFIWNLRYGLLMKMDIATMRNSLEARSPFLSKYFLEIAPRIDKSLKVKKFNTKYILRELAKKYLPDELITAPKRGFEIPLIKWVNEDLNEVIMDYLRYGFYKNFIDSKLVDKIINRKIEIPEERRAKIIYLLFVLEVWAYENCFS